MKYHRFVIFMILAWIPLSGTTAIAGDHNFGARLNRANLRAAAAGRGTGQALFRVSEDGNSINYKVMVSYLSDITSADIHLGKTGPVVAVAYKGPLISDQFTGTIAQGELTAGSLMGPLAGKPLSALIEKFKEGGAYLIINTAQMPGGEIGGQIK